MVYLASPYSHPDQEVQEARYRANLAAAVALSRNGTVVFSPVAYGHAMAGNGMMLSWDVWMAMDLRVLAIATEMIVLTLPGWEDSRGVMTEIEFARGHNIPIRYLSMEEATAGLSVSEIVRICGGPADVARRVGVTRQAVHRWSHGTSKPRPEHRVRIFGRFA